ncbi:MAG: plasmid recombination protein [Bacilli bacterium]|nr:plasmid recombination protein [Bacilli bacterium]
MIYISSLAYSFHIGRNKNKKNSVRKSSSSNKSGTTSLANNAIQNAAALSKADKHNCRKYDDKINDIEIIRGTNSLYNDVKNLYKDEFEDARIEYNSRQTRDDRKIKDYFSHVSNSLKSDLACEIIIELGNKEFWDTKDIDYKKKMTSVYKQQVIDLENLVPNFKIANAIIHYDETSPHMHIIGVPIKVGGKNGMKKQVGKSDVFTKESLRNLQNKMRTLCIESFNKEYNSKDILNEKMEGRNIDYTKKQYIYLKKNIKRHQQTLKKIQEKNNDLSNKTKEIEEILDNLKSKGFVKSELVLKVVDRDKMIAFINLVDRTIVEYESISELTATLKELESELLSNRDRLKLLEQNNDDLALKVDSLTKNIKQKDEEISELKKENLNLKSLLQKLKDKFYFIKHFIITKLIDHKEKDKYVQLTHDLYEHRGLDEDDYKELINFSKPINSSRDYIEKEKDDYER